MVCEDTTYPYTNGQNNHKSIHWSDTNITSVKHVKKYAIDHYTSL